MSTHNVHTAEEGPITLGIVTGSMSRRAGGLFNSVRMGALHLAEQGLNVHVFAGTDEHSIADTPHWMPLPLHLLEPLGPATLGYLPGLAEALDADAPDIVHLHGLWLFSSRDVWRWKKRTQRPVIISPRGMLDSWALANSRWKKRLAGTIFEHRNLTDADCLHALNDSEAQSIRAFGLRNPIAIIPNGTTLPKVCTPQINHGRAERRQLLFLGRIHPKKGLAELITAWAQFQQNDPILAAGWRLVIAGWDDGGHLDGLRSAAAAHGLQDNVLHFAGPAFGEAKEALLSNSHAFILPSYSEGLPMSVLEAWAYGLPVLMTSQCNLQIGFKRGAAIEIPTDPCRMVAVLGTALANPDLRQIGARGRLMAESDFSWQQITVLQKEVYRWLLGIGDKPHCVILD